MSNTEERSCDGLNIIGYTLSGEEYNLIIYSSSLNVSFKDSRTIKRGVIETVGSRYPFVLNHSITNYNSGSCSAIFLTPESERRGYGYSISRTEQLENTAYREDLVDFLTNGLPKIIEHRSGKRRLVSVISDSVETSIGETDDMVSVSFQWNEIGDVNDPDTLAEYGFSDIDPQPPSPRPQLPYALGVSF